MTQEILRAFIRVFLRFDYLRAFTRASLIRSVFYLEAFIRVTQEVLGAFIRVFLRFDNLGAFTRAF